MKAFAILAAYLATGAFHILGDAFEPSYNRPDYIDERNPGLYICALVAWLPLTLLTAWFYWTLGGWDTFWKPWRLCMPYWLVFGSLVWCA